MYPSQLHDAPRSLPERYSDVTTLMKTCLPFVMCVINSCNNRESVMGKYRANPASSFTVQWRYSSEKKKDWREITVYT